MGGGGDKDYERKQIADEKDRSNQEYADYQGALNSGRDTRNAQYDNTFKQTGENLTKFTGDTGGLNQADIDRLRGLYSASPSGSSSGGSGGGGGVSGSGSGGGSALNDIDAKYSSAIGDAKSGFDNVNLDRTNYASNVTGPNLTKVKAGYTGLADTGGISDQDRSDVLRSSLLDQERTGGYTDQDISRIRAKASNNAASTFGAVKDSLDRSRAVNGNTTGLSGTNFKLMREAAKQQAQDKNNAEIGLADAIRANKADAGKFNSGAAAGLITQRDNTKLAGLGGLGTAEMNDANFGLDKARASDEALNNINSNELSLAGGKDNFTLGRSSLVDDASKASLNAALAKASGLDQYSISQAQLGQSASNAAAARAMAEREANADNERWLISQEQSGKQYGTSGLGDLTSLAGQQRLGYDQLYGNTLGDRSNVSQSAIGLGLQNDQQNKSRIGEYITNGLGSVAGIAGGFANPFAKNKKPVATTGGHG